MPSEIDLGQSVRELRVRHNLSIRELAKNSGISVNTLSLIENGKTSPTVSTLQQLAGALEVHVAAFFEAGTSKARIIHIKSGTRKKASLGYYTIENLGAGFINSSIQPFMVTLEPNAGSGGQPIVHTGYEFVLCLKGRVAYHIEDCTYLLEQGESLLFESHLPHHWQNTGTTPSHFLLVLYPTDINDRATDRHFASAHRRRRNRQRRS